MGLDRRDFLIAVVVGCIIGMAYGVSARAFAAHGNRPQFYQEQFAPAVLYACGRGFQNVEPGSSALDDFLQSRRDTLRCDELPGALAYAPFIRSFQPPHQYLLLLAGMIWRTVGVSWAALAWLGAAFGGVSVALGYLLFRAGMGRALALILTVVWATSPFQLGQVPHLRDYAKAPFFLLMVVIVVYLATHRPRAWRTWALMTGAGALLGVGFGMRTDVALYLAPLVFGLLLFRPEPTWADMPIRGIGAAAAIASFLLVAQPLLRSYGTANSFAHVALLGLTDESNHWLHLTRAPYSFGYLYSDGYEATVLSAYAGRTEVRPAPLELGTKRYESVGNEYYGLVWKTFPADMLLRCWASVVEVLKLPFRPDVVRAPPWLPGLTTAYELRAAVLTPLGGLVPIAVACVFAVVLSTQRFRLAVLFVLLVIGEAGICAVQFQGRHIFHLEIVSLWVYGCLGAGVWRAARQRVRASPKWPTLDDAVHKREQWTRRRWVTGVVFAIELLIAIAGPVWAARRVQSRSAQALLERYERADTELLPATLVQQPDKAAMLVQSPILQGRFDGEATSPAPPVRTDVLVLALGGEQCEDDVATLTFRYSARPPFTDLSQSVDVPMPGPHEPAVRVLFPVYSLDPRSFSDPTAISFRGVEISDSQLPCLVEVRRFVHPEAFPLLLETVMPHDWREMRLAQALKETTVVDRRLQWETQRYLRPESLHVTRSMAAHVVPVLAMPIYRAKIVARLEAERIDVRGVADTPGAYLVSWAETPRRRGSIFYVEGDLVAGGLTVGLQSKEKWTGQVNVDRPGPFRIAIQVDGDGAVGPVIANHLIEARRNRFSITKYGWIDAPADPDALNQRGK